MKDKKLFCTVVMGSETLVGVDEPVIFHTWAKTAELAEACVCSDLIEEFNYSPEVVDRFEIHTVEVIEANINEA